MKTGWVFAVLLLLATAGALAFRLPALGARPMHADEAVQAARFRALWLRGCYEYDPSEYHGPTLMYATLPSVWVAAPDSFAKTTEAMYRIVPVLFGAGMVLLLWLLADALGKPAAVFAGVLTALSPAMVYYSRYFIHENLLVFFTLAAIAAAWRYFRSGQLMWCLAAGACLGLMQSTKETSVLAFTAMGLALALTAGWRYVARADVDPDRTHGCRRHWLLGLLVAVLVTVTLLSSFFTNPRGPVDGVLTYLPWLSRAGGESPHVHPWYFYLQRLGYWRLGNGPWWSEGLVLFLAAMGLVFALLPARWSLLPGANVWFARWLGLYTVLLTTAYSLIPYKTPWCLLGFFQGMVLLAGLGAVGLVRMIPGSPHTVLLVLVTWPLRVLVVCLLLASGAHLGWQAYRASFVQSADATNPYVYAHTMPDIQRLSSDLEQLARAGPEGHATVVKVIWQDGYYWPLPWYLRRFERIEYWVQMPGNPAAPLVVSSPKYDVPLTEDLDDTHLMTGYYAIRPNVLAQLWVRMDVWEAHLRRLGRL